MSNGTQVVPFAERIGALTASDVREQVNLIQAIMREVMKKDEHYGVIPGTGNKPTLLKAGAEKLCLTFRLAPDYEVHETREAQHLSITSKCILTHIPTGQRFGAGMGSCSTLESKYNYRHTSRTCPKCGSDAIIKGKEEYGGGWVCFKKKGGCGAKFVDEAPEITQQATGRVLNEDLADQYNTVLKMANKRSLVAAVLNSTAASDIFTQDIEEMAPRDMGDATQVVEPEDQPTVDDRLKVSKEQVDIIKTALEDSTYTLTTFLTKFGLEDLTEIAAIDAPKAVAWLRARAKKTKPEDATTPAGGGK